MKIVKHDDKICGSQEQHVINLLKRFGMEECKGVSTPLPEGVKLSKEDCPGEGTIEQIRMRQFDHRGLVGSLNYLSLTSRPDIANTTHRLRALSFTIQVWSTGEQQNTC